MSHQPPSPRPWVIATALTPLPTPGFFIALGQALSDQGTPVTFLSPPSSLLVQAAPPPTAGPPSTNHGSPLPLPSSPSAFRTPHSALLSCARWPSPRPTGIRDIVFAWRLLRRLRPSVLIANFGAVTPLLLAGWLARVPVRIAWYHTLADYDSYNPNLTPRRLRWLNWRRQQVYRLATHIIAVSEAARQDAIRNFGIAPEKCLVIPNAMRDPLEEFPELQQTNAGATLLKKGDPPALRASQSRLRRVVHMFTLHPPSQNFCSFLRIPQVAPCDRPRLGQQGRPAESAKVQTGLTEGLGTAFPQKGVPNSFLLCIGTLHRAKGQDILLRAMARLKPVFPELRCVFCGEGPAAAELRQLAARLEVADCCHFAGNRPRLEVLQAMQQAAVVVCPSRSEAFGYVLLEAMALGRPVAAAAAGGIPEIVRDGLDGKLFPAGDDQALAAALTHALSTPSEAAAWGRHGRERFLNQFELSQRLPGLIQQLELLSNNHSTLKRLYNQTR